MADLREITSGLGFPEGPIACDDGSVLLVEIRRGTLSRVQPDGRVEVVATCGGGPNGAAFGPDGAVYVCNNGGFEWHDAGGLTVPGHQPANYVGGSIQRVDLATGSVTTLYSSCEGHPLRGPNDLVFDETGGFWFTDHGKIRARDRDVTGLYYARADGSEIREAAFPLDAPNGVGLSPDGRRVYVAETYTGRVWAFDLDGPGRIRPNPTAPHGGHLLVGLPGLQYLDSLAVDAEGNVCVATIVNGGITIVPPDGSRVRHVPTGDPLTTNICFGGPDLRTAWITLSGTGRLVSTPWETPGLRLAFAG
jgi:gluconolactonase